LMSRQFTGDWTEIAAQISNDYRNRVLTVIAV